MITLTVDQIIIINTLAIKETGGLVGIRDVGRLKSVVASQDQEIYGEVLFKSFYDKAAALIRGIVQDHPFTDGNKRTAMLCGITFLKNNNIVFKANIHEIENFAVKIAVENLDVPAIAEWLERHCTQ